MFLDDTVALAPPEYVKPTPGRLSGPIGSFQLVGKRLHDAVRLRVKIVEEDTFGDDDAGQGFATVTVGELREARSFPLRPKDGSPLTNEATFRIENGLPREEPLPPWTNQ